VPKPKEVFHFCGLDKTLLLLLGGVLVVSRFLHDITRLYGDPLPLKGLYIF
jgi:hypothetical protein